MKMNDYVENAVELWKQIREAEEMIAKLNALRDNYKKALNVLGDEEMKEYLKRVKALKKHTIKQNH